MPDSPSQFLDRLLSAPIAAINQLVDDRWPRNDPVSLTVSSARFEDPRFVHHLVNRYRDLGWSVDFEQTGTRIALTLTVRDLDVIGAKKEPPVQRPAVLGPNDVLQRIAMVNGQGTVEQKLPAQFSFDEPVDLPLASTANGISNHPAVVRFLFNTYRLLGWDIEVAKASPIAIFRVRFPAGKIPTIRDDAGGTPALPAT